MSKALLVIVAFLVAIIVPSLVMVGLYSYDSVLTGAWAQMRTIALMVVFVAAAHVLLLGVPVFLLVRRFRPITLPITLLFGFLLGTLPIGAVTWPFHYAAPGSSSSHWRDGKMVATMVDGVPTWEGWLSWIYGAGFMGLLGITGAFAFWLVWRKSIGSLPGANVQNDAG